jgi:hypothetical protein
MFKINNALEKRLRACHITLPISRRSQRSAESGG